ncbi:MAG TPA: SRPBCC family protein [Acidimicrobiia bacterium]
MQISQEFTVARSVGQVWEMFQDIAAVAQCLPGATLNEDRGNRVYSGSVAVKLGPIAAKFEGEASVTPDPPSHSAVIEGKGVDKRGGSRGQVRVTYRLAGEGSNTRVTIDADISLAGPAAQFGRTGLVNEMSRRLIADFATCLEAKLAAPNPAAAEEIVAPEVRPLTMLWHSFVQWLRRLFTRPG